LIQAVTARNRTVLLALGLLLLGGLSAQQKADRIRIQQADEGYYKKGGERINRLIGSVIFEHEGALLHCDSAWLYADQNLLEAFENVRVIQDDTIHLYSDYLRYNGNTRLAEADRNVTLRDPSMTLTTDHLDFDRNTQAADYRTGGVIVDEENTLRSLKGIYFSQSRTFHFSTDVELTNMRYEMFSDTLRYHSSTKVARFLGPSRILSDSSRIYCENGFYDTRSDIAQFKQNAELWDGPQRLKGDSLFYDRNQGLGEAFGQVSLLDTVENSLITGQRGDYREFPEMAAVGGEPLYSLFESGDSLHIHGDSIFYMGDSLGHGLLKIFHRVRIFREDMQGVCDSLTYSTIDSTFRLYDAPALWSGKSQMTGDTIRLEMRLQKMDSLKIDGNAFVLSKDSLEHFNQVRGKRMKGNFHGGELKNMNSYGNGQTVYYAQEDDGDYLGVNRTDCSNIKMHFQDQEIDRVTFLVKPVSNLYPMSKVPEGELELKGFQNRFNERPLDKASVFD
jgi:lipopolysaccharide export system protein LptA